MAEPILRVVRGDATAEEIAALVAVLARRSVTGPGGESPARSAWNDRSRLLRLPPVPTQTPGAWRISALPR